MSRDWKKVLQPLLLCLSKVFFKKIVYGLPLIIRYYKTFTLNREWLAFTPVKDTCGRIMVNCFASHNLIEHNLIS